MYLLDTNTFSDARDARRSVAELRIQILNKPPQSLHISVVTAEEILKGILSSINRARSQSQDAVRLIKRYEMFRDTLRDLTAWNILPYDEEADDAFRKIPSEVRRRNPQDARIAAIALSRQLTVITSNTRDFERIPALKLEDWTRTG